MELETLLENFDAICELPGGIDKVRALIPSLVIQKRSSLSLPKYFKNNEFNEIFWCNSKDCFKFFLSEAVEFSSFQTISLDCIPSNEWILELEDIEKNSSKLIKRKQKENQSANNPRILFKKKDVLYGRLRPYLNKVLVADMDGYCTTEIVVMTPKKGVVSEYIMYTLKQFNFLEYAKIKTCGASLPRLRIKDLKNFPIFLPSTEDQIIIVNKIELLQTLCDRLQTAKKNRDTLHKKLSNKSTQIN